MIKTKKVAMVYHILPHYREPIFRLLSQQHGAVEFTFFSDAVNTHDSVKTIDPQKAKWPIDQGGLRWQFVKNKWIFQNLLWQKGVVSLAFSKKFDTIVYLGSAYYISTWVSATLARLTGKHVLMWSHGFLRNEKGLKDWIRGVFYRLANSILLYHSRAKQIFIQKGFESKNLHVVYNSLDYDTQTKIRNQIGDKDRWSSRKKLFKNPDIPILLFIGRLTPQKKLEMIIEAVKILKDRGLQCNALFIGDGSERKKLLKLAKQLQLDDHLCLYGDCYDEDQIALLVSASDICVAPGEIGLTCMHSLVYGTPVITHDHPDFQGPEYEAITPGYNGAFFKKDDIEDLANTIEQWLTDNKDKLRVRKQCIEVIDNFYNPYYQLKIIKTAVMAKPS